MSRNVQPYDFGEARDVIAQASSNMKAAEQFTRDAFNKYASAERAYRKALALKILELRADGIPVTICLDLAKGESHVADLRYARDVADGVKESAQSATWRHTADRKDLTELVQWSKRVAPDGQYEEAGVR